MKGSGASGNRAEEGGGVRRACLDQGSGFESYISYIYVWRGVQGARGGRSGVGVRVEGAGGTWRARARRLCAALASRGRSTCTFGVWP